MNNHKIGLVIPTTVNVNQAASKETVNKWVRAEVRFAELFGGFTAYSAIGGWKSPTQGLVEENVTIVQAFTDDAGLFNVAAIKALANEIAVDMGQEAVALEVDNTLHFVAPLSVAA